MIYFIIQLIETLKTGHVFLFEVFSIYVLMVFFIKYYYSKKYTQYTLKDENFKITNSVIIPVYNEDIDIFEQSLNSIKSNNPDEIIVVIDVKQEGNILFDIASKYTDKVYNCDKAGKRSNLIYGVEKSIGDVIISVDSDTIFTENAIKNMMMPFENSKVGGVLTRQHIIYPDRNLISKFCQWMEDVRFTLTMPAQSAWGSIGCLVGRAIAFRKDVFTKNTDHFLTQTFLGFKCESGDDRVLTSYALKMGYDTVLQTSSVVYTDCPSKWNKFIKQQLRWARSSQRETILSLNWIWKRPFTMFVFLTDMITPLFFAVVILNTLYDYIFSQSYFNIPLIIGIPMGLVGMNISLGLRQYPHLLYNKRDIKYLPLYILFMTFIMTPIRIYGFFTMYHSGWMTRSKNEKIVTMDSNYNKKSKKENLKSNVNEN
jgi:hyaluronan synthase